MSWPGTIAKRSCSECTLRSRWLFHDLGVRAKPPDDRLRRLASKHDRTREEMKFDPLRAGASSKHREGGLHVETEPLRENSLRLLDDHARIERLLELRGALAPELGVLLILVHPRLPARRTHKRDEEMSGGGQDLGRDSAEARSEPSAAAILHIRYRVYRRCKRAYLAEAEFACGVGRAPRPRASASSLAPSGRTPLAFSRVEPFSNGRARADLGDDDVVRLLAHDVLDVSHVVPGLDEE